MVFGQRLPSTVTAIFVLVYVLALAGVLALIAIPYKRWLPRSVSPLDYPHGAADSDHDAAFVVGDFLFSLLVALPFIFHVNRKSFFGVWVLVLGGLLGGQFGYQAHLTADRFRTCHGRDYDTRLEMTAHTYGRLQLLRSGESFRALRRYDGGLHLGLSVLDPNMTSLPFTVLDLNLSEDGSNNSVAIRVGAAGDPIAIGAVRFRIADAGLVEFALLSRVFRMPAGQYWWTNPNRVVDGNGTEVARILQKSMGSSRHVAICGHRRNLDLTFALGAITQQFQSYASDCYNLYQPWICKKCDASNISMAVCEKVRELHPDEVKTSCQGITC